MSAQNKSESSNEQTALARRVRELSIPVPFDLETFGSWMEQHSGHPARLIPVSMEPGALSGLLLQRSDADYLYYEQQASRYHQSHIVLCLAARMLIGEVAGLSIDPQLVPDLSQPLAQLMFRNLTNMLSPDQADMFAFLVLNRTGAGPLTRNLQQLRSLREALHGIIPHTDDLAVPGLGATTGFRVHRQVIEIRDAMLVLRPYTEPQVASAAVSAFQTAGIAGDDLAAAVEASVLASALAAKVAKQAPRPAGNAFNWRRVASSDLASEAVWLGKVSQAFTQMSRHEEQSVLKRTDAR
jgi:hypothetical protein